MFQVSPKLDEQLERNRTKIIQEGGWSGGGGSGVSCFKDPKDAALARQAWEHAVPISPDLVKKIISLKVTDYWETENEIEYEIPYPGETVDSYLLRVLSPLQRISPTIWRRLHNKLQSIFLDAHLSQVSLTPYNDLGKIESAQKDPHCAFVQIAHRVSKLGPDGKTQEFTLVVDKNLLAILKTKSGKTSAEGLINQALLKLHEAIYLLGSETGQLTSEKTRLLSRMFLIQGFWKRFEEGASIDGPNAAGGSLIYLFSMIGFGDIVSLYSENLTGTSLFKIRQDGYNQMRRLVQSGMVLVAKSQNINWEEFSNKLKSDRQFFLSVVLWGTIHDAPSLSDAGAFAWFSNSAEELGFVQDTSSIFDREQYLASQSKVKKICSSLKEITQKLYPFAEFGEELAKKAQAANEIILEKAERHCLLEE
ncbi:MAG: hypothetical protein ACXVCP_10980 [Bdellovibrio sp.]